MIYLSTELNGEAGPGLACNDTFEAAYNLKKAGVLCMITLYGTPDECEGAYRSLAQMDASDIRSLADDLEAGKLEAGTHDLWIGPAQSIRLSVTISEE